VKQWRAYVIGFAPSGESFDKTLAAERIKACDFCVQTLTNETVPIGETWIAAAMSESGDGNAPPIGTEVRCVAHEHGGKVIVVEEVSRPS